MCQTFIQLDAVNADPIGIGFLVLNDTAFCSLNHGSILSFLRQSDKEGRTAKVFVVFKIVMLYSSQWARFLKFVPALLGASFIAFVEKTIQINDIDLTNAPLASTTQLLPFLVDLSSAASLIWVSVRKFGRKKGLRWTT
jgi:hypothetical protein